MKLIEALKKVKLIDGQIEELRQRVQMNCALTNIETPPYKEQQGEQVRNWLQSIHDLVKYAEQLNLQIQYTNIMTPVTIQLGGQNVTKSIAAWILRRRKYARSEYNAWASLSDRGLREETRPATVAGAEPIRITIIRFFDPAERDTKLREYNSEPSIIDANLEVVNATTDLLPLPGDSE